MRPPFERDAELQPVLDTIDKSLSLLEAHHGRERDERLDEIEKVVEPYALALYDEIKRLEACLSVTYRRFN